MPEPTSTATVTIAAGAVVVPTLTAFGVSLGLRPDLLAAGFFGALAAMALLNSVPSTGDTWREMLRTAGRRMAVALASSLTSGYMVPMVLLFAKLPDPLLLSGSFVVGAGAQKVLAVGIKRFSQDSEGGAA